MDYSKLEGLRQVRIEKPCSANWHEMEGDEQQRHCSACNHKVNNIAEFTAKQAEELMASPNRVCIRVACDRKQRILTKDGWIPRAIAAGAIAATVAGCTKASTPAISASTPTASVSTASSTFIDKLVEQFGVIYEEILDIILPSRKKITYIAGSMATPYLPSSSLPPAPITPKSKGTITVKTHSDKGK